MDLTKLNSTTSMTSTEKNVTSGGSSGYGTDSSKYSINDLCTPTQSANSKRVSRDGKIYSVCDRLHKLLRSEKTRNEQVLNIPASQHKGSAHCGYLDVQNKKRKWERFWCVLIDCCLHLYISPNSEVTCNVILLRGYDVIANVTDDHRSIFVIRLQRKRSSELRFSTDNHRDFLYWTASFEKELSSSSDCHKSDLTKHMSSLNSLLSHANEIENENASEGNSVDQSTKNQYSSKEDVKSMKMNLLRDIYNKQNSYLQELKMLEGFSRGDIRSVAKSPTTFDEAVHTPELIFQANERMRISGMTHLLRRRNSLQIKANQITKDIASKQNRKKKQICFNEVAMMENNLCKMKRHLRLIDRKIHALHDQKQVILETARERKELELFRKMQIQVKGLLQSHGKWRAFDDQKQNYPNASSSLNDDLFNVSDCSNFNSDFAYIEQLAEKIKPSLKSEAQDDLSKTLPIEVEVTSQRLTSSLSRFSRIRDSRSFIHDKLLLPCKRSKKIDSLIVEKIQSFENFSKQHLEKKKNYSLNNNTVTI